MQTHPTLYYRCEISDKVNRNSSVLGSFSNVVIVDIKVIVGVCFSFEIKD